MYAFLRFSTRILLKKHKNLEHFKSNPYYNTNSAYNTT